MKAGSILVTAGLLLLAIQYENHRRPWPPIKQRLVQTIAISPTGAGDATVQAPTRRVGER